MGKEEEREDGREGALCAVSGLSSDEEERTSLFWDVEGTGRRAEVVLMDDGEVSGEIVLLLLLLILLLSSLGVFVLMLTESQFGLEFELEGTSASDEAVARGERRLGSEADSEEDSE